MTVIAVLGAQGTGKTTLAAELAAFLTHHELSDVEVHEGALPSAALTLVTGLDLFLPDDRCAAQDAGIRAQLHATGMPFQVVYGTGPERLRAALCALAAAGVLPAGLAPRHEKSGASRAWIGACEKCSDPDCEHRLFTRLRQQR